MTDTGQSTAPMLRIVKGDPTVEELAALVTVLIARQPQPSGPEQPRSAWADRQRGLRRPLQPSRGGWRASARPH